MEWAQEDLENVNEEPEPVAVAEIDIKILPKLPFDGFTTPDRVFAKQLRNWFKDCLGLLWFNFLLVIFHSYSFTFTLQELYMVLKNGTQIHGRAFLGIQSAILRIWQHLLVGKSFPLPILPVLAWIDSKFGGITY